MSHCPRGCPRPSSAEIALAIHARYEFHGRHHTFVADLHITENDTVTPVTATIQGVVTRGWLRGAQVTGQYTQFTTCPIPTPGNVFGTTCFQGTLHLQKR